MSLSYFVSCFVLSGFVGVPATGEIEDMTITEGGKDTDDEDTDGEKTLEGLRSIHARQDLNRRVRQRNKRKEARQPSF